MGRQQGASEDAAGEVEPAHPFASRVMVCTTPWGRQLSLPPAMVDRLEFYTCKEVTVHEAAEVSSQREGKLTANTWTQKHVH